MPLFSSSLLVVHQSGEKHETGRDGLREDGPATSTEVLESTVCNVESTHGKVKSRVKTNPKGEK